MSESAKIIKVVRFSPFKIWKTPWFHMDIQGDDAYEYLKVIISTSSQAEYLIINIDLLDVSVYYKFVDHLMTPLINFASDFTDSKVIIMTSCRVKQLWAIYYGVAYQNLDSSLISDGLECDDIKAMFPKYNEHINKHKRYFISREVENSDNVIFMPVGTIETDLVKIYDCIDKYNTYSATDISQCLKISIEETIEKTNVLVERKHILKLRKEDLPNEYHYCSINKAFKDNEV